MFPTTRTMTLISMLMLALVVPPALAQGSLQVQEQQGIRFLSGGIGLEEREALAAVQSDFNLKLTFALSTGNFLSNIEVRIIDVQGAVVLEATSDGPIFLARMPAGNYTVQVTGMGQQQQQSVQIGQRQAGLNFFWRSG